MSESKKRNSTQVGRWGERLASEVLERRGFELLTKNFLCGEGEIDLIMLKEGSLHFIEVKTWVLPFEELSQALNIRKQERIRRSALIYREERKLSEFEMSFDLFFIKNSFPKKMLYLPHLF